MKQIVLIVYIFVLVTVSVGQDKTPNRGLCDIDLIIRMVEVMDSQFMDQVLFVTENDSVKGVLNDYYMPLLDFRETKEKNYYHTVYIDKRHYYPPMYKDDTVFSTLVTDEIKDILTSDSLNQVVLTISSYSFGEYETYYKGRHFYFVDKESINNKPIFRVTKKHRTVTENAGKKLESLSGNAMLPFIYYNNRLFVDPESIQWNAVCE